ncbi:MAG: phosphopentomutase [Lachnospiraceae bacterium]|nr:phosphopentomutase [Lachnospiraceae bacterium]
MSRVFLIVLDSVGCGELPDAADFGDAGTNTLLSCSKSKFFDMENMRKMGYFNIDGVDIGPKELNPTGAFCKLKEVSKGKDTTIGHWEISGIISKNPLPTYPNGFPDEVLDEFKKKTGRGVLCNLPYSGTAVIDEYGKKHIETGDLIIYTSADSVFQIAAHEDVVPVETLYEYCQIARDILQGEHGVGRVIARPFIGEPGNFTRTSRRHDFSLEPTGVTMLDKIKDAGKDVLSVGKIVDIFVERGITEYVRTEGNADGIEKTLKYMDKDFDGLCFVNLVDYDMLYGHRRDIDGYAKALTYFDKKIPEMISKLKDDDILMVTADHGCDPAFLKTTDHTREYIPLLMYGKNIKAGTNYGIRDTFADIAETVLSYLGVEAIGTGKAIF